MKTTFSKITQIIFAVLLVLLTTAIFTGCSKTTDYNAGMKQLYVELAKAKNHISGEAINFEALEKIYNKYFTDLANEYNEEAAFKIRTAIDKGKEGELISVQKQWIEKGLQRVIYHTAVKELDKALSDKRALSKAENLLTALEPVMDRRGSWLKTGSQLKEGIRAELSSLKKDTAGGEQYINNIKKSMDQVYFLCVLWELKGLTEAKGNTDKLLVKKAETTAYYNVLAPSIKDAALKKIMETELTKEAGEIDTAALKKALISSMPEIWENLPEHIKTS